MKVPEKPEPGKCDYYDMVRHFHKKFGHPAPETIHPLTKRDRILRCHLMMEEVIEIAAEDHLINQVDGLLDLLYFVMGTFVTMGVDPREIFDVVHESNMGKLWPDGNVKYNEKGKVIKPPTWEGPEPEIMAILRKRMLSEDDEGIPF